MKVTAVIPAAGAGKRMGAGINKQYMMLGQRPVLAHTLEAFEACPRVDEVVLVVSPGEMDYCRREIVEQNNFQKVSHLVAGGGTRQQSVFNGLKALQESVSRPELVAVHDGARPLAGVDLIQRVVEKAASCGAAIAAVPVKDTIKSVSDGLVTATLDRSRLWAVQTPQVFRFETLWQAHLLAAERGIDATDDSGLVELLGVSVAVVMGSHRNLKITTPEDLSVAERYLKEL